jgi:hypothetical protein
MPLFHFTKALSMRLLQSLCVMYSGAPNIILPHQDLSGQNKEISCIKTMSEHDLVVAEAADWGPELTQV